MGTMHYKIFRIVIDSLMGASSPWMIIPAGMYIAGLWRLLEKSGIKGPMRQDLPAGQMRRPGPGRLQGLHRTAHLSDPECSCL